MSEGKHIEIDGQARRAALQDFMDQERAEGEKQAKQIAERLASRMAARKTALKVESAKQDLAIQAARMVRDEKQAFQEEERHKRKQVFEAAEASDRAIHTACDEDDVAMKGQVEDKQILHAYKTSVDGFEIEAKELDKEIKRLQLLWRDKRTEYGHTKDLMHRHAVNMAVRNPERTKENVAEAYKASGEAWDALPKLTAKRRRDRRAKKRAKVIITRG